MVWKLVSYQEVGEIGMDMSTTLRCTVTASPELPPGCSMTPYNHLS